MWYRLIWENLKLERNVVEDKLDWRENADDEVEKNWETFRQSINKTCYFK